MSTPATSFPSAPRTAPNVHHAFGGIWRLTARRFLQPGQLLSLFAMLAVLGVISLSMVSDQQVSHYFKWVIGFYLTFLVPVMAFLSGAGAIRDDMKAGSVDYILTRPVRRYAFVIFKYLSHMACTQLVYFLALGVLIAIGFFREISFLGEALPMLLLAQMLVVAASLALGFFFGALTSRYLILGLLYAGIIEAGVGQIPTQLARLSMTRQIHGLLDNLRGVGIRDFGPTLSDHPLVTVTVLLAFSTALVTLTALYFSRLELAGAKPRDT